MNKLKLSLISGILLLFLIGCDDDSSSTGPNLEGVSAQKQFVWNAMNFWYFWQEDVPELKDDRDFFNNGDDFREFLISFPDTEALFQELLFTEEDDFSFFIDNFEEFRQSQQGISRDFGFEFGLVRISDSNNIFGYVQFVLDDAPADTAGLARGDIFTRVNGTALTVDNFREILDADTYNLGMAEIQDGNINDTDKVVRVESTILQENPIFMSKVVESEGNRVGYLMYNSFQTNTHAELNDIFADFNSEIIDELVVDLRYNSGGAVVTSTALATMISGEDSSSEFARFTFNSKRSGNNDVVNFMDELPLFNEEREQVGTEPINTLTSLNRVFVLTGASTASASESLINGLIPFVDVILIGRQTVGKDEGSITLFDAGTPFTNEDEANPEHRNAIQPIVLKIVNAEGQDFPFGFEPDFPVNEIELLENLPPLGDPADPLLAKAIEQISGPMAVKRQRPDISFRGELYKSKSDLEKRSGVMYLMPGDITLLTQPD